MKSDFYKKIILSASLVLGGVGVVAGVALAVTANINTGASERYAWNNAIGWIDFGNGEVEVTNSELKGYASSSVGYIALDCATTPTPPAADCAGGAGNWGVVNDGLGNLSGWGWNDNIGWISFFGVSPDYSVTFNTSSGFFSGWAWNDVIGWISFNCNNSGIGDTCTVSDYKDVTSFSAPVLPSSAELTSSIFDTQATGGAAINTVMWQGNLPSGAEVSFQIASSNSSSGPWNYLGSDGTSMTFYEPAGPNIQVKIRRADHNNRRYVRYKILLTTYGGQSPTVDDVIINYSP